MINFNGNHAADDLVKISASSLLIDLRTFASIYALHVNVQTGGPSYRTKQMIYNDLYAAVYRI